MNKKRPVGRPSSTAASGHAAIIEAVYVLLDSMSVRDLTMEAVARRAGVGKPTLYKWWGSKAELVMAMLEERMVPDLTSPTSPDLETSIRIKARRLVDIGRGYFGRVLCGLIAEGQSDLTILERLRTTYIMPRRAETISDIQSAQEIGQFPLGVDPERIVDFVFGSIYFALLTGTHVLDHSYADALVDTAFSQIVGGDTITTTTLLAAEDQTTQGKAAAEPE
ncbi:MAG: TetR/AcrR family transcriptional regulator [Rhizomicrobium sp.]